MNPPSERDQARVAADVGPESIEIIAHRGYSARAPENTVASLRAALDAGAQALEWDIQVAASGTPYLFHDDTLERTTDGRGAFSEADDAGLAVLDAGSWFGEEFRGEPVPTLRGALAALDRRATRIYPEIKTFREPGHVDTIVGEVRRAGWLERTVFISMDWDALAQVRRRASEVAVGYIVEAPGRYEAAVELATGDPLALIDPDYRIVLEHPETTARARAAGVPLAVWTVNDERTAQLLWERGVTRFTTNEVDRLRRWCTSRGTTAR